MTTTHIINLTMPSENIYSIDLAFNATEWDSVDAAIKTKPMLIVVETWTNWKNFEFTNKKFHYKFFSNGILSNQVSVGPSEITLVSTTRGQNYHMDQVFFDFVDARGEVIHLKGPFGERVKGIIEAVKFVVEVNKAGNYQNYSLLKENEQLRHQIEEMKKVHGK